MSSKVVAATPGVSPVAWIALGPGAERSGIVNDRRTPPAAAVVIDSATAVWSLRFHETRTSTAASSGTPDVALTAVADGIGGAATWAEREHAAGPRRRRSANCFDKGSSRCLERRDARQIVESAVRRELVRRGAGLCESVKRRRRSPPGDSAPDGPTRSGVPTLRARTKISDGRTAWVGSYSTERPRAPGRAARRFAASPA